MSVRPHSSPLEESLRENWKQYRMLFDIERDAIMLIDLVTHNYVEVNRAAERLYGYSREEFLKMRTADVNAEQEKTDFSTKEKALKELVCGHDWLEAGFFPRRQRR